MKNIRKLENLIVLSIMIFTLILNAATTEAATPALFFSDLDWGPKSGWEGSSSKGAAVTIWGKNFGATRGSSYVTVNGAQITEYAEWGATGPARSIERITFWLNSSCNDGDGQITVTVGGATSNALSFKVVAGTIYFISPSGSNSNNGLYSSSQGGSNGPFRDIYMFNPGTLSNGANPSGDGQYIVYVRGGTYSNQDVDEAFLALRGPYGGETKRKALIGYPTETPILNASSGGRGGVWIAQYSPYGRVNYFTYAKITVQGGTQAFGVWGDYTRVVGNTMKDMLAEAWTGVVMVDNSQYTRVYGNMFDHCGYDSYKHNIYVKTHPDYVSGDKSVDYAYLGWNEFKDAYAGSDNRGGVIFISRAGSTSGKFTRNVHVHDSYFHGGNMDYFYIGDGYEIGDVFIYNNIFHSGGSSQNGGMTFYEGTTNVSFYNNIIYKIAPASMPMAFGTGTARVMFKNNIWYSSSGQAFAYLESFKGATFSYDHDLFYDPAGSTTLPSGSGISTTGCLTGDPKFTNATSFDFHLLSSSPAIDAGVSTVNQYVSKDYDGVQRPQNSSYDIGAYEYSTGSETPTPTLSVTPISLDFGSTESSKTFNITNVGASTLTWSISDNSQWITVSPVSGSTTTETDQATVTIDRGTLAAGNYTGTVTVTSDGGNATINISMTVAATTQPVLAAAPTALDFGSTETSKPFTINNSGSGTLTWTISDNSQWITVTPVSGSTTTETDQVTVTVARGTLAAGNYTGTVTVTSDGGNATINISMTVAATTQPVLAVAPTALDFGSTETSKTFAINNSGSGTLTWTISDNSQWITVTPVSGSTTTETDEVTVTVARGTLAAGNYTGTVTVTSNGGNATINVSMTVAATSQPVLAVAPTALDFGSTETSKTFAINNSGSGTLTWTISDNSQWITVTPVSGSTTTETDEVTVTVARGTLAAGNYTGTVTVTSNGGNATINVSMTVAATSQPVLAVAPTALDFGSTETSKTFAISNSGSGTLNWTLNDNRQWISANPNRGNTTNESDQVTVTVNRGTLAAGSYTGTVTLTSNGGNATINISMSVAATNPPVLAVTPTTLDFGNTETAKTFAITNSGSGTLTWTISDNSQWITVNPVNGSTTSETDQVTVTVARGALAAGNYTGTVTITSTNGGSTVVNVNMTIAADTIPPAQPQGLKVVVKQ